MFRYIAEKHPKDKDHDERTRRLQLLKSILDSKFYDVQTAPFHQERNYNNNEYISLRDRRPAVQYNLCKTVVRDSATILFGADHFPAITSEDKAVQDWLKAVVTEARLPYHMVDAAIKGSIGSVCIVLRVLGKKGKPGKFFLEALNTIYMIPQFDPEDPETLISVKERYKVSADQLKANGYVQDDVDSTDPESAGWQMSSTRYWVQREFTQDEEILYRPLEHKLDEPIENRTFRRDEKKTVRHGLGFVPVLWVKNLPGGENPDGMCTFEDVIDTQIEMDYQLSQLGRGLKYSQDPTLMLRDVDETQGGIIKGEGALIVGPEGDAKLLEINGRASAAVLEYVEHLRKYMLEVAHGSRINPEQSSIPQSGKAMELLNLSLIELAGTLRLTYGEALRRLLMMMLEVAASRKVKVKGAPALSLSADSLDSIELNFIWPPWYPPMAQDRFQDAQAIAALKQVNVLSTQAAVEYVAPEYDVADPQEELSRVEKERTEQQAHEKALKSGGPDNAGRTNPAKLNNQHAA